MVTTVPPASGPKDGSRAVMDAPTATYSNDSSAESPPSSSTTTTSTVAMACAGVVTVICVSLSTVNAVPRVPSNVTPVAPRNPVPVMVTTVPPSSDPLVGSSEVATEATARYSKSSGVLSPAASTTTTSTVPTAPAGEVTVI